MLFVFDFVCAAILFVLNTSGFYENPLTERKLAEAGARISTATSRPSTAAAAATSESTSIADLSQSVSFALGIAQVERNEAIKAKKVSVAALCVVLVNLLVLYPVMRRTGGSDGVTGRAASDEPHST